MLNSLLHWNLLSACQQVNMEFRYLPSSKKWQFGCVLTFRQSPLPLEKISTARWVLFTSLVWWVWKCWFRYQRLSDGDHMWRDIKEFHQVIYSSPPYQLGRWLIAGLSVKSERFLKSQDGTEKRTSFSKSVCRNLALFASKKGNQNGIKNNFLIWPRIQLDPAGPSLATQHCWVGTFLAVGTPRQFGIIMTNSSATWLFWISNRVSLGIDKNSYHNNETLSPLPFSLSKASRPLLAIRIFSNSMKSGGYHCFLVLLININFLK